MPEEVIRIFSDIHYGDRSSRVERLDALAPLVEGASAWVVNGDALETRPGPHPEFTAQCRSDFDAFLRRTGLPVTLVTGNHDPDISAVHDLSFAGGLVYVTHGDILFEDIVPWGRDVSLIRERFAAARRQGAPRSLAERYAELRLVAASIPQRHQSERHHWRYLVRVLHDTVWPPWRIPKIFAAWESVPRRARSLAGRHSLPARFMITGHTHWPGVWRNRRGLTVINSGSFCRPFGGCVIDLADERIVVRQVEGRRNEFHAGRRVAELRLDRPAR